MAKIALIVLLSFALFLSAKPIVGHQQTPKLPDETELGPAPDGDAAEDGEGISSDQLKKIGSEVKEAFQKIEDSVNEATSPEQEEQILEEFAKEISLSPGDDDDYDGLGPTSDDGDVADVPLSDGGDAADGPSSGSGDAADAPSSGGGGAADAPSSEGGKGSSASSGDADAPSPSDDDEDSSS